MTSVSSARPQPALSQGAVLCLLNGAAHSDGAEKQRGLVAEAFTKLGKHVHIEMPSNCDAIEDTARQAVQNGAKLVIAGGGDGTMNAVANALAGSETALGVLPMGTLNHFAKDLGIPLDIDDAVVNALEGNVRRVDVAEVNGRVFINNSSIGLYPEIVREREALQKRGHSKWVAFAEAMVEVVHRSSAIRVRLKTPARSTKTRTDFVFIGNNEYELAAPRIGARVRMDGGQLWVCNVPHTGRFRAILAALRAFFAVQAPRSPLAFCTRELRIDTGHQSVDVAADGEVFRLQTPLLYRSRPRALHVMVPAASSG
ncbi:MAG: diacylglycerol/lipid kinase family protein [Rhizomicrobium sp.]|jgi:diacylglycerol kinase family enzyme